MVDCYCGCDTKGNRIKFFVSGVLLFLSMVFCFIAGSSANDCFSAEDIGCSRADLAGDVSAEIQMRCDGVADESAECVAKHGAWLARMYAAWLFTLIGSSIPLCMLCCCSRPPSRTEAVATAPIQMVNRGKHYSAIPNSQSAHSDKWPLLSAELV